MCLELALPLPGRTGAHQAWALQRRMDMRMDASG